MASLVLAVVVAVVGGRVYVNMNVPGSPHTPANALVDFRDAVYYPVTAALEGNNPYDVEAYRARYPVNNRFPAYAPSHLLLYLPFAALPHGAAQTLYLGLNLLLSALLCLATLRICGIRPTPAQTMLGAAAIVLSHPGELNLFVGQSGALMTSATYGAVWFAASSPALAGALLAVTATKPTFGIPVFALLALRGNTTAVAYGAAFTTVSCLAGFAWIAVGVGGVEPAASAIVDNIAGWGQTRWTGYQTSAHRSDVFFLVAHALGRPAPRVFTFAVMLGLLAVGGTCLRRSTTGNSPTQRRSAVAVISCITLSGFYHQAYDALLLCVPVAAAWVGVAPYASTEGRISRAVVVIAGTIIGANYLSTYAVLGYLEQFPTVRTAVVSLNALAAATITAVVLRQASIVSPSAQAHTSDAVRTATTRRENRT